MRCVCKLPIYSFPHERNKKAGEIPRPNASHFKLSYFNPISFERNPVPIGLFSLTACTARSTAFF